MMYFEELIKMAYAEGLEEIKECRPFLLHDSYIELVENLHTADTDVEDALGYFEVHDDEGVFDNPLPFKVVCFETRTCFKKVHGSEIVAIAAIEKDPLSWDLFVLLKFPNQMSFLNLQHSSKDETRIKLYNSIKVTLQVILHQMRKDGRFGLEPCHRKIKVKNGNKKDYAKINRIVHVYPKKIKPESIIPAYGGRIEFTHRFEVRGHWVRVDNIGKNREGIYNVKGFTWRVPHERGPKDLPLIRKTRVVHIEKNNSEINPLT